MTRSRSTAYFDCFSGAAGDMIIGALIDCGLSLQELEKEILKINLNGYKISSNKVQRAGIAGTKFNVEVLKPQPVRHFDEIKDLIYRSTLDDEIKNISIDIFLRLAEAEAKVHNSSLEKIHFHEVGAIDAIIDICGAVIGIKLLEIERIFCSPLVLGKGSVQTGHGLLPVPAPATAELIKGVPSKIGQIEAELTTPTGAAILTSIADFRETQEFVIKTIGYGAGKRDIDGSPNMIRLMIGNTAEYFDNDTILQMESNLDRVTAENLGSLIDTLMEKGALEAFVIPVTMKKNRPGHLLTVLCEVKDKDILAREIFRMGSTLGIRFDYRNRLKLARQEKLVQIEGESIKIKIAEIDGEKLIFPEHDSILNLMKKNNLSYDDIFFQIQSEIRKGVKNG